MFEGKTILVTGGAGFIGSNIVEYLLKKTNVLTVRVIDNLSTGNMDNIKDYLPNKRFQFIKGDICDYQTCWNVLENVDLICHQAALGSVSRSLETPINSHNSNVNGFLNILDCAVKHGIKRIVYASSSSVYGDHPNLPKTEELIGDQLSPYAVTKYIDELYAKVFHKCYNIETVGLRYFNVFGPKQNPNGPYAAVIPKFIINCLNNKPIKINGDGEYSRDFTFISNVVDANIRALHTDNNKVYGEVFNIGFGGRVTINNLVEYLSKCLGKDIIPEYGEIRKGDIPHSNASIEKAKEMLGYIPTVDFIAGLNMTINYYRINVESE